MRKKYVDFVESPGGLITVLFGGLMVFTGAGLFIHYFPASTDNHVMSTFVIGLANQFSGALFLYIKQKSTSTVEASGKSVEVNVDQSKPAETSSTSPSA